MGERAYLIRYGVMGHVGRFQAATECAGPLDRGQVVVIETDRGVELGEVLIPVAEPPAGAARPRVLRLAGPEDLARSRRAEAMRPDRFALCRRALQEGDWPGELIDVELMLDGCATVLYYLGPHRLDAASLRARFRMMYDFDVLLEPVGSDLDESKIEAGDETSPTPDHAGCGSCGGSDGGCGARAGRQPARGGIAAESAARGCATPPHSGCASCGIGRLLAARGGRAAVGTC